MRRLVAVAVVLAAAGAGALEAQSEGELRRFFEGRTVVILIDMPGTDDGVDVYPGTAQPIDFPKHAGRLKRFGTSIRRGEDALVTKIRLKNDLIEFHLGGGGYGTFWDDASPYVAVPSVPKTEREKNLEADLRRATTDAERRRIREELDGLRKEREREEARLRTEAEQASQLKEANIRQRRLEGGSRFNLRYRGGVPADEATPDAVIRALGEYVDFGSLTDRADPLPHRPATIRKGLLERDLSALLGEPDTVATRMEGTLTVRVAVYLTPSERIDAELVEGVLVRYRITPR